MVNADLLLDCEIERKTLIVEDVFFNIKLVLIVF